MQRVASVSLGEVGNHDAGVDGQAIANCDEAPEVGSLADDKMKMATERLQQRMLMNNPVRAASKLVQCADEGEKKKADYLGDFKRMVKHRISAFDWIPLVNVRTIKCDLVAGLTVVVMVIPQSMSYANIAGLPYVYGMYAACVPAIVYAFFGQSKQLAVGPVAMVSIIVEAGLRDVLDENSCPGWTKDSGKATYEVCPDEYARLAMLTAALVGILQILASVAKLGFLVSFLGHPVTSGFTSAAAIIIGLSQMKYVLGYDLAKSQFIYEALGNIFKDIHKTKPAPLICGILALTFLIVVRKVSRKYKKLAMLGPVGPLILCILGSVLMLVWPALNEDYYVKYVGAVPSGLMPFSANKFDFSLLSKAIPTAMTATIIGYMESIAIAKNLAAQHGYEIDAGQELLGLGLANLVGSIFSCYAVAGSFSRSAVNNSTGARSQLSGLITGVLLFIILIFLTSLFYYLPKFVLAAVVLSSVIQLVAYGEAIKLWRIRKTDFLCWTAAFLGTLLLGILPGISVAVGLSLFIVIFESARPQISVLWRIPGTSIYRSMKQESSGVFIPNIFISRIGSSMYFANASFIRDILVGYISDLQDLSPIEYLILEMTPVVSIDSTAVHLLHDLVHDFRSRGIHVAFAMIGNRVEKTMRKAGVTDFIGEAWFHCTVDDAVHYCMKHQQAMRKKRAIQEDGEAIEKSMSPEEELAIVPATARCTDEVGFSNEIHHAFTTMFVSLVRDTPELASQLKVLFSSMAVTVVRLQVEPCRDGGARYTYMLQSRNSNKLTDAEVRQLQEEVPGLVASSRCDSAVPKAEELAVNITQV